MTHPAPDSPANRNTRAHLRRMFDALLPASEHELRRDALGAFLKALIAQMAIARGLDVPHADQGYGLTAAGIDWARVDPTLPGDVYTDLMAGRHGQGSYFTPRALADRVVGWTLGAATEESELGVLDPAMGGGHFLMAAADALAGVGADSGRRWEVACSLHGADRDPMAVMLARSALWLWAAHPGTEPDDLAGRLLSGDALLDDLWDEASFDVVIGNPPYASVFTRAGGDGAEREALSERYATATGSYDLAVVFVEAAIRLTKQDGRCGLVIPNKLLAADYARTLREWIAKRAEVEVLAELPESGGFDAGVYPAVMVVRKGTASADGPLAAVRGNQRLERRQADLRGTPGGVWSPVMAPDLAEVRRLWEGESISLGAAAHIAAGLTVSEAYSLRDAVFDAPPTLASGEFYPLITTGLIECGRVTWGERRARFLKQTYRRPVIAGSMLPVRRREQARGPKILIAGLGREPRAVYDPGGLLASVGTLIITEADWPLPLLCNWLNSPQVARLYQVLFGGLALSGGYLRFGKRELALLPVPRVLPDWENV